MLMTKSSCQSTATQNRDSDRRTQRRHGKSSSRWQEWLSIDHSPLLSRMVQQVMIEGEEDHPPCRRSQARWSACCLDSARPIERMGLSASCAISLKWVEVDRASQVLHVRPATERLSRDIDLLICSTPWMLASPARSRKRAKRARRIYVTHSVDVARWQRIAVIVMIQAARQWMHGPHRIIGYSNMNAAERHQNCHGARPILERFATESKRRAASARTVQSSFVVPYQCLQTVPLLRISIEIFYKQTRCDQPEAHRQDRASFKENCV